MSEEAFTNYRRDEPSCANVALTPAKLLAISRGFLCLFWGLPVGLMLFTGAISLAVFRQFRLPAYVIGVLIAYCGVLHLRRTGSLTPLWNRRLRMAILLALLQVYLAPFLHWWERAPTQSYFTANVIVLLFATAWAFFVINMLAAELARVLRDNTFRIESQLSAWISFFLMLLPLFEVLAVSAALQASAGGSSLVEFIPALFLLPRWASAFIVVPFTLTMAVAWKAKEQALHRLAAGGGPARTEGSPR